MQINGRDVRFLLTVGAAMEIADMCPEGDIGRIGEILDGNGLQVTATIMRMGAAMSRGYAEAERYAGRETARPMTPEEALALPVTESAELTREILEAFAAGKRQEIATEPDQEKNA